MIDREYGPKTRNAAQGEIRNLHTPQTDFISNRRPSRKIMIKRLVREHEYPAG
jgi:hypothetical protein